MNLNNFYFNLKLSPWPILLTMNLMNMMFNLIYFLNYKFNILFLINLMLNLNLLIIWLNFSIYNNLILGYMNFYLKLTKKIFLFMFIISEMMFFITFFYINFSFSLFNNTFMNFNNLNLFNLNFFMALTNSIILISSSMTIMYSMMMNINMNKKMFTYLKLSIYLSMYFILIQMFEFKFLLFNLSNSIIMSNFFMLTSFHMFHVFMGFTLMFIYLKFKSKFMMPMNLEFKMICIYWHFIDLIWIFIFIFLY